MKRITIIFFVILLLCAYNVFADEHLLYSGKCYIFNDVLKTSDDADYAIKYDDEDDVFFLRIDDWINKAWIHLTRNDIAKLRKNIEKYFEWEKLAVEKAVKLEKDLPDSTINTEVTWKFGDDWQSAMGLNVYFVFFSQNTTRHQLVLYSSKVTSYKNQFITYKMDDLYFDKNQVQQLYNAIKEETLSKQLEEIKKNNEIKNIFN